LEYFPHPGGPFAHFLQVHSNLGDSPQPKFGGYVSSPMACQILVTLYTHDGKLEDGARLGADGPRVMQAYRSSHSCSMLLFL